MDWMSDQNPFRKDGGAAGKSSAGVPPAGFLTRTNNLSIRNRGHLPHWEVAAAIYFVTFRLADSLPQVTLRNILFIREDIPATAAKMGPGNFRSGTEASSETEGPTD